MPAQPVVVFRTAHAALDVRRLASRDDGAAVRIVAFVADAAARGESCESVPVVGLAEWRARWPELPCLVVAADAAVRRAQAERVTAAGGSFARLDRSDGALSPNVSAGEGTIIGPGPLLIARATRFGRHAIVVPPVSIGHDCTIGDFVTIYPSVVSGYVELGDDVVVGPGAVIVNGSERSAVRVGRGVRIGAGAVVTKSVPAGAFVAGNPGRIAAAPPLSRLDHED